MEIVVARQHYMHNEYQGYIVMRGKPLHNEYQVYIVMRGKPLHNEYQVIYSNEGKTLMYWLHMKQSGYLPGELLVPDQQLKCIKALSRTS